MKRLALILATLLGLTTAAAAQTRPLPPPEIGADNSIRFGKALTLGKREAGKTIITPDTLQILGPGSTGDLSTMSVAPTSGGISRLMREILSNEIYAANFGVVPGDGVDDGPALRTALGVAQARRARLRLPPGTIDVCTDPNDTEGLLRITSLVEIAGASRGSRIEPCQAAGTRSVILIKPLKNGGGIRGPVLRDFAIGELGVTRAGGDGIRVDTTNLNGFVAKLLVENVSVADAGVGKWSFHHINSYTPSSQGVAEDGNVTGGMFASTFRDNDFFGGMRFFETGDSNNVERSIITGPNFGIEYQAIAGAATARFVGNNITAWGGAIVARNMQQVKILENQLEQVVAPTAGLPNPAVIRVDNVADWVARDNNINGYSYANIVTALNNSRGGRLGPNTTTYDTAHYLFHATSSPGNVVERQLVENDATNGATVTGRGLVSVDAASPTFGVWQKLATAGGWTDGTDPSFRRGLWWMPLADGTIHLSGIIKGGSTAPGTNIVTFPANFRPAIAYRIPSMALNAGVWGLGVFIVDAAGGLSVQAVNDNTLVQFDGTSFNIRP